MENTDLSVDIPPPGDLRTEIEKFITMFPFFKVVPWTPTEKEIPIQSFWKFEGSHWSGLDLTLRISINGVNKSTIDAAGKKTLNEYLLDSRVHPSQGLEPVWWLGTGALKFAETTGVSCDGIKQAIMQRTSTLVPGGDEEMDTDVSDAVILEQLKRVRRNNQESRFD
jgi:hypothetical protein